MGHCYRVELTRRVAAPLYGPYAYTRDTLRREFPFGKGKEFSTGKVACEVAHAFAQRMMELASEVSVWRMNGGSGTGEYLKSGDNCSLFSIGWNGGDKHE